MQRLVIFFVVSTLFILPGCSSERTIPELMKKFFDNKSSLDKLVLDLQNDRIVDSVCASPDFTLDKIKNLSPHKYHLLLDLGITEIISYQGPCKKSKNYDFKTNWAGKNPIHVNFNSCDSIEAETQKGFYRKDENSNEFFGLGNCWKMWKEVKILENVKI